MVPTSRAELYKEASALGASVGESAKYYLRVMEKLTNGTETYVEKEAKRSVMLSFPHVTVSDAVACS